MLSNGLTLLFIDVCQANEDKIIIMLRDILEWSI